MFNLKLELVDERLSALDRLRYRPSEQDPSVGEIRPVISAWDPMKLKSLVKALPPSKAPEV